MNYKTALCNTALGKKLLAQVACIRVFVSKTVTVIFLGARGSGGFCCISFWIDLNNCPKGFYNHLFFEVEGNINLFVLLQIDYLD